MRHIASISGVSSSVTSIVAPSIGDLPDRPAPANRAGRTACETPLGSPSMIDGSPSSTVSAARRSDLRLRRPAVARPAVRRRSILAPTVSRILSASSRGTASSPVAPNSIIARMGDHQPVAQPVLAIGGQARGVEEARSPAARSRSSASAAGPRRRSSPRRRDAGDGRRDARRGVGRADQRSARRLAAAWSGDSSDMVVLHDRRE